MIDEKWELTSRNHILKGKLKFVLIDGTKCIKSNFDGITIKDFEEDVSNSTNIEDKNFLYKQNNKKWYRLRKTKAVFK